MATVTIQMSSDGSYRLLPPFIILTAADQGITWNLSGANWQWMSTPPGIVCEPSPPSPPYAAWPGAAASFNSTTKQYTADANSPNRGADWVYYKWTFTVINTSTGTIVQVDPDIGNQPEPS